MYVARIHVDDNTLVCALTLERRSDGHISCIGRNLRSINVVWKQTQIGDVLIVDNQLDPDMNELFVLYPRNADENVVVLYKSPPIPFGERFEREHGSHQRREVPHAVFPYVRPVTAESELVRQLVRVQPEVGPVVARRFD